MLQTDQERILKKNHFFFNPQKKTEILFKVLSNDTKIVADIKDFLEKQNPLIAISQQDIHNFIQNTYIPQIEKDGTATKIFREYLERYEAKTQTNEGSPSCHL